MQLKGGPVLSFLKVYGGVALSIFLADAAVEAVKFPHLDLIPPGSDDSYFEQYALIGGSALTIVGLLSMFSRKELFGIGSWALPVGLGTITGVALYEYKGSKLLGIRRGGTNAGFLA